MKEKSYFDGGLFELIAVIIAGTVITTLTFGIFFPWALCLNYRFKINHTVVEGKRLRFNGKAISLFGTWLKLAFLFILLCIVYAALIYSSYNHNIMFLLLFSGVLIFPVYTVWATIQIEKWKASNIDFAD